LRLLQLKVGEMLNVGETWLVRTLGRAISGRAHPDSHGRQPRSSATETPALIH
jgi:hypothetical protein